VLRIDKTIANKTEVACGLSSPGAIAVPGKTLVYANGNGNILRKEL
jgi:hypothetical protein